MVKLLPPLPQERRPLLFAHRGVSSIAPENTLAAFRKALEFGIPGIELDIHLCASGELFVTHDHNLKRLTGLDAIIETLQAREIRELDAGSWKSLEFSGERIPTLDELFDLVGDKMYYDIEIKAKKREPEGLEESLLALIENYGLSKKIVVSSFNPFSVKRFKALCPSIPTAVIYSNSKDIPFPLRFGAGKWISMCDFIKPSWKKVNPFSVFISKTLEGRELIPWTTDDPEEALRLIRTGVSGIISNRPQDMIAMIRKLQEGGKA